MSLEVTLRSTLFFNLSLALKLSSQLLSFSLVFSFPLTLKSQGRKAIDNLIRYLRVKAFVVILKFRKEGSMINRGSEKSCGETHSLSSQ